MCGISGIINKNNMRVSNVEIKKMNDLIKHRGPDDEGYYFHRNIALGHRRLSIIDLSNQGKQPMDFQDKYVIVFNGEIYNYEELRKKIGNGYSYKSNTDTEVIIAAYDKWGKECVNYFNGMWAFAIYDKERQILFCSRDRFGIKPFYYTNIGEKFVFASEIKQFSSFKEWRAVGNKSRIVDFLMFEMFDHTKETLFEGVYQLNGGQNLVYDVKNGQYKIYDYYFLEKNNTSENKDFDISCKKVYDLLEESIKLRIKSDVKVGSCLSGGLDSSAIVCIVNNILRKNSNDFQQETVSSCFDNLKYDEREYINEVVKGTGVISHKIFPDFNQLFNSLDKITWHQDEPFGSTSIFAQWNVFNKAKEEKIKVMLDGQGADEQFAGYPNFYGVYISELIRNINISDIISELNSSNDKKALVKNSIKYLIPNSIKSIIKNKMKSGIFEWINIEDQYYNEYLNNLYGTKIKSLKDYSHNQLFYSSLPKLLHYEDRDSMAHSVETRVPFLDYRLVELVYNLPSSYKIKNSVTKYIMREALLDVIPEKVNNRRDKMGFVTPEEEWIRGNSDLFRERIKEACEHIGDLIDGNKILKWYDSLIKGNSPIDFTIWRIISLGNWIKVFNVDMS